MLAMLALLTWGAAAQPPARTKPIPKRAASPPRTQDPSNYIEVIEEIGNKQILHYYPSAAHDYLRSRMFKVDHGSILLIRVVPDRLSSDSPMSNLLITAQLKHGSTTTNVEVKGYSVVGQSQTSGQSQTAVNTNSIANVIAQMQNLFFVAQLILQNAAPGCLAQIQASTAPLFDQALQAACKGEAASKPDDALSKIFASYQAEISTFANFFTDPQNAFLQTYFANAFFGMDLSSVQSVAKEFQAALPSMTPDKKAAATTTTTTNWQELLNRTILAYQDIWSEIVDQKASAGEQRLNDLRPWIEKRKPTPDEIQAAVDDYFRETAYKLFSTLKEYLVDGEIVLADYKGSLGDVLTVNIEAKPPATPNNNNPTGAVLQFQITLDGFGMNIGPSSSMFFLKRIGVANPKASSTTPPNPQPVNFGPSPGASFGFVFRYRSYGKCTEPTQNAAQTDSQEQVCQDNSRLGLEKPGDSPDKHPNYMREPSSALGQIWRGLAPGLAMNVSFMNWNAPTDYDPTTGKFTNSSSASIQVGAGFVASLFDNQLQFTYGWNLQVPQKRQYWGVGFGFVEIGKTLAGYAKAKTSGQ